MRRGNDYTLDNLIQELQEQRHIYGGETKVHIGYEYGDRAGTVVAPAVRVITEEFVKDSDRFKTWTVQEYEDEDCELVLVIRSSL